MIRRLAGSIELGEKQRRDDVQTAELISRGTAPVQIMTGIDGSMHPVFLEALRSHGGPGAPIRTPQFPRTSPRRLSRFRPQTGPNDTAEIWFSMRGRDISGASFLL